MVVWCCAYDSNNKSSIWSFSFYFNDDYEVLTDIVYFQAAIRIKNTNNIVIVVDQNYDNNTEKMVANPLYYNSGVLASYFPTILNCDIYDNSSGNCLRCSIS